MIPITWLRKLRLTGARALARVSSRQACFLNQSFNSLSCLTCQALAQELADLCSNQGQGPEAAYFPSRGTISSYITWVGVSAGEDYKHGSQLQNSSIMGPKFSLGEFTGFRGDKAYK